MKHHLIKSFIFILVIFGLSIFQEVNAETVSENIKTSDLEIEIKESPVVLTKVIAPTFGVYKVSKNNQKILATGDLVIYVNDQRINKKSPWLLKYGLSVFENKIGETLSKSPVLTIGEGQLTSNGIAIAADSYQTSNISLAANRDEQLVQAVSTDNNQFEYRVSKKKIQLEIPGGTPAGKYSAVQTVMLVNVAKAN